MVIYHFLDGGYSDIRTMDIADPEMFAFYINSKMSHMGRTFNFC